MYVCHYQSAPKHSRFVPGTKKQTQGVPERLVITNMSEYWPRMIARDRPTPNPPRQIYFVFPVILSC